MESPGPRNRLRLRLVQAARAETQKVLSQLLRSYPQLKTVRFSYQDLVSDEQLQARVGKEAESCSWDNEIVLFVFTVYELAGKRPEDYRERIQRAVLHEIGKVVGEDLGEE